MDFKGKKILILAGAGVHCKDVIAAKELGAYTIVTDYLDPHLSPAKQIADESWNISITDIDAIVVKCKEEQVDGVISHCIDPAQIPYMEICERLGLPCYGTREQFEILTDKRRFKDYCLSHNVDVIPDYTEEDILNDRVEYPVFIKPTNSRGSRGQSICNNKDEALIGLTNARNESSDGNYVCEKYMGGKQDIASAFFVVDGEPYVVKFGDRHLGRIEDNLDKQVMCTWLPSKYTDMFEENVLNRVKNMIRSLGIKFGPVFLQGFVDGNTIRYYDPALRMPGGDYDLILKHSTGFDIAKSLVHFALTGDSRICFGSPADCYKLNGGVGLLMCASVKPGLLYKVQGFEEIRRHCNVIYARQIIPEGEVIPDSGDVRQRAAAIGAYLKSELDVPSFLNDFYNTYRIIDESGNDMIISKFEQKS